MYKLTHTWNPPLSLSLSSSTKKYRDSLWHKRTSTTFIHHNPKPNKVRSQLLFPTCFFAVALLASAAAAATLRGQCSDDLQKVTTCLSYATGKAATPTKECCDSVTEIKGTDPVCLCYIMLVTHNGSEQIKSMGIQESRLIQLPTACKLTNASISDCPKLLNIPSSSPDYSIFTNTTSVTTTPRTGTGTGTGTSSVTTPTSDRSIHGPQLMPLVAIAMDLEGLVKALLFILLRCFLDFYEL